MSQRIEAERKDMKLGEIKELNLDGCVASEIEGISDEYTSLQRLSLVDVGLTTLTGLPALPSLTKLNVAGNPIATGIAVLTQCPNLEMINLSGNKLKSVADLAPLSALEHFSALELNNCEIAAIDNYRKEVFAVLPKLKFLDGLDQNGEEEPTVPKETAENGDVVDDEDDEEEDDDEEDAEEEIGISALQGSKELDDDEEDYVPGEEDDVEDDVGDDDEDDSGEDEDADEVNEDDVIANLSGAGVTGPRRAVKRVAEEGEETEATSAKCPAPEANGDCVEEATNGASDDE